MAISKKTLSIVVPTFNEEDNIEYAYKEITKVLEKIPKYDYEIIFVDNYSTDKSRKIIKTITKKIKKLQRFLCQEILLLNILHMRR